LKYVIAERGETWARKRLSDYLGKTLLPCWPMPSFQVPDHLGWHERGDAKLYLGIPIASDRIVDREGALLRSAFAPNGPALWLRRNNTLEALSTLGERQSAQVGAVEPEDTPRNWRSAAAEQLVELRSASPVDRDHLAVNYGLVDIEDGSHLCSRRRDEHLQHSDKAPRVVGAEDLDARSADAKSSASAGLRGGATAMLAAIPSASARSGNERWSKRPHAREVLAAAPSAPRLTAKGPGMRLMPYAGPAGWVLYGRGRLANPWSRLSRREGVGAGPAGALRRRAVLGLFPTRFPTRIETMRWDLAG
jgi:hypothetical protein